MNTDASEEMQGLGNSVRLGIVKIGSVVDSFDIYVYNLKVII